MVKIFEKFKLYREYILIMALDQFVFIFLGAFLLSIVEPNPVEHIQQILMYNRLPLESLIIITIVPIMEEIIFRLCIYTILSKMVSKKKAVIISSILFGLCHEPNMMISAFLGGIVFCEIYIKSGNIWYSILLHAFANGLNVIWNYNDVKLLENIMHSPLLTGAIFITLTFMFFKVLKEYLRKRKKLYKNLLLK